MGRRHNDFVSLYNAVALLLSRLKYLNPELFIDMKALTAFVFQEKPKRRFHVIYVM